VSDDATFLTALKANPADDTTRLVYADWLDEHNESARGDYLRAVVDLARHPGGTAEYTDAVERLYCACANTDEEWRAIAGARFDVFLEDYGPGEKVPMIWVIRKRAGLGLAEAKAMVESVPTAFFSWLPFERAFPHLLAFQHDGTSRTPTAARATIRPTVWPEPPVPGAVFDVLLCRADLDSWYQFMLGRLANLLGTTEDDLRDRLRALPLVVASGLQPAALAERVRRLKLILNVRTAMPADAIRVVPRLPNT
jgi:uncharacterized protein (TIGR02996 family)